uniref:SFRICE_012775 n=1 Tax=Spodoptera frugiperda TaxID=7108 RepID=A0A2H1WQA0_SPOFR
MPSPPFYEAVMLTKKEAERVREQTSSRPSRRERHSGRRDRVTISGHLADDIEPGKVTKEIVGLLES